MFMSWKEMKLSTGTFPKDQELSKKLIDRLHLKKEKKAVSEASESALFKISETSMAFSSFH